MLVILDYMTRLHCRSYCVNNTKGYRFQGFMYKIIITRPSPIIKSKGFSQSAFKNEIQIFIGKFVMKAEN